MLNIHVENLNIQKYFSKCSWPVRSPLPKYITEVEMVNIATVGFVLKPCAQHLHKRKTRKSAKV